MYPSLVYVAPEIESTRALWAARASVLRRGRAIALIRSLLRSLFGYWTTATSDTAPFVICTCTWTGPYLVSTTAPLNPCGPDAVGAAARAVDDTTVADGVSPAGADGTTEGDVTTVVDAATVGDPTGITAGRPDSAWVAAWLVSKWANQYVRPLVATQLTASALNRAERAGRRRFGAMVRSASATGFAAPPLAGWDVGGPTRRRSGSPTRFELFCRPILTSKHGMVSPGWARPWSKL